MKKQVMLLYFLIIFIIQLLAQTPEWVWAKNAGGIGHSDIGFGVCTDSDENVYISGWFIDTVNFGSFSLSGSGCEDIFVSKLDSDGNWLWANSGGGIYSDRCFGIIADTDGNIYITGEFSDTANFGPFTLNTDGYSDIFIAKLDANGNWLWAKRAGGSGDTISRDICTDAECNIYITGEHGGTANFGSFVLYGNSSFEIVVAKMDTNGNWLWAKNAGGNESDVGRSISVDTNDNVYITGSFEDMATFGNFSLNGDDYKDIFIAKLDTDGNWLWAEEAGSNNYDDDSFGIVSDPEGNIFATGFFEDTANFGPFTLISYGFIDIFVAKLDSNGNWLWANKAGGLAGDSGYDIGIDSLGNAYITGSFNMYSANFGPFTLMNAGGKDIFIAKLDTNGNWIWAENAGGCEDDDAYGITAYSNDNLYVTGYFKDTANFGSHNIVSDGWEDIFVAKFGDNTSLGENVFHGTLINLSNYPNPFNPTTTIDFSIHKDSEVNISIFNIKGQNIKTLANNEFTQGTHSIIWNGDDDFRNPVSSGIYFYKLKTENYEKTRRMVLLK